MHSWTHWLKPCNLQLPTPPPLPPPPPSISRALLVSQGRRHLLVTPWYIKNCQPPLICRARTAGCAPCSSSAAGGWSTPPSATPTPPVRSHSPSSTRSAAAGLPPPSQTSWNSSAGGARCCAIAISPSSTWCISC